MQVHQEEKGRRGGGAHFCIYFFPGGICFLLCLCVCFFAGGRWEVGFVFVRERGHTAGVACSLHGVLRSKILSPRSLTLERDLAEKRALSARRLLFVNGGSIN